MSIRKDKIVIVDLEATCWEGFHAPEGQENEIIEIGICLFDPSDDAISHARGILVKPEESIISEFCTELTTITPELVEEEGISFKQALRILEQDYDTRNRLWGSWGNFDRKFLQTQCRRRDMRYPMSQKHSNLKRVYQSTEGQYIGLAHAMSKLSIEPLGTAHRGVDDAFNTARVLSHLVREHGEKILYRDGW